MLKPKLVALAVASVTALAAAPSAHAATDYFMRLDPGAGDQQILGETQDATFPGNKGYIQLKSFNWGIENPTTIGSMSGGAGAGKAKLNELTVEKEVDSTTPQILQRVGQGRHFAGVEIVARKAGGTAKQASSPTRYYFSLAYPTSQQQSGDGGDDALNEKLTFVYGSVAQKVIRLAPNGTTGTNVFGGWNQVLNSATIDTLPDDMK